MYAHGKASHSGGPEEPAARRWRWIAKRRPHFFVWTGVLLFWFACINSETLPIESLLVGPALMLSGVVMIERNKRELR